MHAIKAIETNLAGALILLASGFASAQAENPAATIELAESWSTVFAGKDPGSPHDVDVHLVIKAPKDFKGRLSWSFFIDKAAMERREVAFPASQDNPARVKITLRVPFVREGIVVEGKLAAALIREGRNVPAAAYQKRLWIYPYQPFFHRQKWLKDLAIVLYDPKDTTAPLLKKMDIPFEEFPNASALADLKNGLVLVGEGVSFEEERGLPDLLFQAAARGLSVLCLAPTQGFVPISAAEQAALPAGVSFKDAAIVTRLDKRLDSHGWPKDGKVIASAFALRAMDGVVAAEVTGGKDGWPWLEIDYPSRGRLIFCGFGMMSHWDAGPAPRFLFARILEHLTNKGATGPAQ